MLHNFCTELYLIRPLFNSYGKNFVFDPRGSLFTYSTITIGNDVYIGPGANFISTNNWIKIGNNVMFGPNVTITGGDHNTSVVGKFMINVHEKRPQDDLPIVIEDDVWICTGATILKGVIIGRGAIVAAGAVVTKNVPPYSLAGGVPARFLKWRWNINEILGHEESLYPPELRIKKELLEELQGTLA